MKKDSKEVIKELNNNLEKLDKVDGFHIMITLRNKNKLEHWSGCVHMNDEHIFDSLQGLKRLNEKKHTIDITKVQRKFN